MRQLIRPISVRYIHKKEIIVYYEKNYRHQKVIKMLKISYRMQTWLNMIYPAQSRCNLNSRKRIQQLLCGYRRGFCME